jgi:hypothetical protein
LEVGVFLAVRLEVAAFFAERFGVDAVLAVRLEVAAFFAERFGVDAVLAVRLEAAAFLAERFGVDAVLVERSEVAAVLAVRFDADAVLAVTVAMSDSFLDLSFEPNAVRCTCSSRTAGPNDRRVPHAGTAPHHPP